MSEKTLDCVICGRVTPINGMFSMDADSEKCQSIITELAELNSALDEARKVIDRMWTHSRLDGQCEPQDLLDAAAWLEKYPKKIL